MEAEDDGRMGEKMTDEEQKKLCAWLRDQEQPTCAKAADEIERLAALVQSCKKAADKIERHQDPNKWPSRETVERAHARAQSDAEPPKDFYSGVFRGPDWPNGVFDPPPLPDASAGLIEAAEIADKSAKYHQQQFNLVNTVKQQLISSSKAMVAKEIAKNIRARVVNRNAK